MTGASGGDISAWKMEQVGFKFGDSRELCDELLALVRSGAKTATCGALRDFEAGEPMPQVGRRDLALDWDGKPVLMIETIEADADRVTRLITELLDVSRIDARRLTLHARPIDVAQLFGRHIERIVASGHAGTFTTHVGVDTVWGDPDRIEQLLANVVDNALRHASSRVHLSSQPGPGGAVDLVVDDDGPGVPPERRELVFGKFWHGRAPGSTGLGLYIVRGLAEAHGGTVVIQEAPLGGARVRVRLPSHEDH